MPLIPLGKVQGDNIQQSAESKITAIYTPTFWTRCPKHRPLDDSEFVALMQSGSDLACCRPDKREPYYNLIVDKWHESHQKHLLKTNGAAEDLGIDYIAVGTGYSTPAAGDTTLTKEIHRGSPVTSYANGNKTTVFILTVAEGSGNPAFSGSTVATITGTTNTTTQIVLQSGQGASFTANDLIRVSIAASGNEDSVVQSISVDTLTLKAANALSQAPASGDTVVIKWGELGTFCGAATASLNTGTLISHTLINEIKDSVTFATIEIQIITASV